MAIISTPTAHCGLAPDAVDNVDSNEGILYSTQAGGAKKNYINDSFISAYMMLRLNKGKNGWRIKSTFCIRKRDQKYVW